MEESSVQSMSMVDHQQIALQREGAVGGQDHYPIGWRDDGLARRAGYVDAAMIGARLALIDALRSEQAGDAADARPDEALAPALRVRHAIARSGDPFQFGLEIGRASCRERVCQSV